MAISSCTSHAYLSFLGGMNASRVHTQNKKKQPYTAAAKNVVDIFSYGMSIGNT